MLQVQISTKQELMKLLQGANVKQIIAKDIHVPEDLNGFKKSALGLMRIGVSLTAFVIAV